MDGASREVTTAAAPARGLYQLEIELYRPTEAQGLRNLSYLVHVGAGEQAQTLAGTLGADPERSEVFLARGESARIFFERLPAMLRVRLRPRPVPWSFIQLAALAVAALAAITDSLSASGRRRGLVAAAAAASAIFVALLDPEAHPGGRLAFGAGMLAVVAGGLYGAVVGWLGGRWSYFASRIPRALVTSSVSRYSVSSFKRPSASRHTQQ